MATCPNLKSMKHGQHETTFAHFLSALDEYLYSVGWYINGRRIIKRGYTTHEAVAQYLFEHCYERDEATAIVERIRNEVMNDQHKELWERGYNDYWNGIEQNNCPTFPEIERRNAWMEGWLFGKWSDEVSHEKPIEPQ